MATNTYKKRISKSKLRKRKTYSAILLALVLVFIGVIVVYYALAGTTKYSYDSVTKKPSGRPFSADSPINQEVPANIQYLADSNTRLNTITPGANVSLLSWSLPIYDATIDTPKSVVFCTLYLCPDISKAKVPVPADVVKQRGEDGHLTVIDNANRLTYDYALWRDCVLRLNPIQANWCPESGGVNSIDGNAIGGGTNVARLAGSAGVIRTYEIQQGSIDHALVFGTNNTCATDFVIPALGTDGKSTNKANCITIGSRIQLSPNFKTDSIKNPYQRMIAKALQKYGAYVNDSGTKMGFYTELDRTPNKDVYQKAGVPAGTDYYALNEIPWSNVSIIKPQWNKDGSKSYSWGTGDTGSLKLTTQNTGPVANNIPPTAPTNVISTATFDTSMFLGWGTSYDIDGVSGYKVYVNDKQVGSTQGLGYYLQGLSRGTSYKISVSSYDSKGAESTKNSVSLTTRNGCFLFACW